MTYRPAVALLAALAVLSTGCKAVDVMCAGVGRPAFEVTVVDGVSGTAIADGAVVYVFRLPDLVRVDSVLGRSPSDPIATSERTGRFNVVVERAGYLPLTSENLEVTAGCSVRTVSFTAQLMPRGIADASPGVH